MSIINDVPQDRLIMEDGKPSRSFLSFLKSVYILCRAEQQYGATAQRPTTDLWIGRQFFDTTLNQPIFVKTLIPVVWIDAAGTPV